MPAIVVGLILLILGFPVPTGAQQSPVPLPGTELHQFHSEILNQDLELYVKLPWSYDEGDGEYRVLFCLDGNRSFPLWSTASSIPFVESQYRVASNGRMLAGASLGGLFTLYALFHAPETFGSYFAGSPSMWEELFQYEEAYAEHHGDLPVRLLLTAASLESDRTISGVGEMVDRLRTRGYPGLDIRVRIFEGETHSTSYPPFINETLKELLGEG